MTDSDLIERLRHEAEISDRPGQMDRLNALADEFASALEAAREDAARYRWLKKSAFCNVWERGDGIALVVPRSAMADIDSKIDAAIDAALSKEAGND